MSWTYVHSDRVRFGDLDPMGHVNNVDFLRFFESARIAFHRTIPESNADARNSDSRARFISISELTRAL